MNTTEFRQYILGSVRKVFDGLKPNDELAPVAFILSDNLAVLPIGRFFQSDRTKDALMMILGQVASQAECKGIALVNEIWVAEVSAEEADDEENLIRPSEREDRREAALVRLEMRRGQVECWMAPITKNPDGTRTMAEFTSSPMADGRMAAALFPENQPVVH